MIQIKNTQPNQFNPGGRSLIYIFRFLTESVISSTETTDDEDSFTFWWFTETEHEMNKLMNQRRCSCCSCSSEPLNHFSRICCKSVISPCLLFIIHQKLQLARCVQKENYFSQQRNNDWKTLLFSFSRRWNFSKQILGLNFSRPPCDKTSRNETLPVCWRGHYVGAANMWPAVCLLVKKEKAAPPSICKQTYPNKPFLQFWSKTQIKHKLHDLPCWTRLQMLDNNYQRYTVMINVQFTIWTLPHQLVYLTFNHFCLVLIRGENVEYQSLQVLTSLYSD